MESPLFSAEDFTKIHPFQSLPFAFYSTTLHFVVYMRPDPCGINSLWLTVALVIMIPVEYQQLLLSCTECKEDCLVLYIIVQKNMSAITSQREYSRMQ